VGTGFADTENIYFNISKPLGILAGTLDVVKSYAYLYFVNMLLTQIDKMAATHDLNSFYSCDLLMLYGVAMLIGHCLPLTQHFRGGRGIFTYFGIMAFFTFYPSIITGLLALLLVFAFRQIRFAQYTIVILPVLLTQLCSSFDFCSMLAPQHHLAALFTSKLMGIVVLMGILNFIVSKKLGEI